MNSAEDDLEAAIWSAMTYHQVTTPFPVEFIETIKGVALDYAAGDSDALTATRRTLLHEASGPRPRQTSGSGATGGDEPARRREQPDGLAGSPPEGATISTGPDIPYPGQGLFKLRPQAVDNEWWAGALGPDDDLPGPVRATRGAGPGSTT